MNQAVNNLLSRESDDGEEDGSSGVIGFSIPNAAGGGLHLECIVWCALIITQHVECALIRVIRSVEYVVCTNWSVVMCFNWSVPPEELMSLLGSGLVGVGEDEVEEALSRSREEGGGGRDSRISLYELSDPSLQVHAHRCSVKWKSEVPYSRKI